MVSKILGVPILVHNGDRSEFLQDPYTYAPSFTESTPLGAAESFPLGSYLRSTYLDSSSPLHILDIPLDPPHPILLSRINVHTKLGGMAATIINSGIVLLRGTFPPTPLNKIDLANGSSVVDPLGGYQYVERDHAPESWTDSKVRISLRRGGTVGRYGRVRCGPGCLVVWSDRF